MRSTAVTPYPLASVTKPIVATVALLLAERGMIDLDAPAVRYVDPALARAIGAHNGPAYTVRQLLSHAAGLGTYAEIYWADRPDRRRTLAESVRRFGFPAQAPGVVSEYSNLGYGILGELVARQGGGRLDDVVARELFAPLGMGGAWLDVGDTASLARAAAWRRSATKYDARGARLAGTYNDTPGAGNAYASAHDLALFGAFHIGQHPRQAAVGVSERSLRGMRAHVMPGVRYPYYNASPYGLGWYFRTTADGEEVVWHEGGMPGASALLVLLPRRELSVAVLINATDANALAQRFANALMRGVDPGVREVTFDPVEGFTRYQGHAPLLGRWDGEIAVDGRAVPWSLEFLPNGNAHAEFPSLRSDDSTGRPPLRVPFTPLLNGDLVLATLETTLADVNAGNPANALLLLRLVRRGDELTGAAVTYASTRRLEHLRPYRATLRLRR